MQVLIKLGTWHSDFYLKYISINTLLNQQTDTWDLQGQEWFNDTSPRKNTTEFQLHEPTGGQKASHGDDIGPI